MAVRRTKQQKAAAQQKRLETLSFSLDEITGETPAKKSSRSKQRPKSRNRQATSLVMNDPQLIVADLRRTVFVTTVVISMLAAIGWWMRTFLA